MLAVDQRSGFSLLHAAILEGRYGTVVTTGIFVNDVLREMAYVSTGKHAKSFASKTGYEILTQLDRRETSKIKAFLDREVEKAGTLTELHRCGDNDDAELAVELVLHHGIDVNSVAKGGRTPFLWVSARCSSVIAKTLIDLGADTNAQREDKCTSLILATHWNNYMTIRLLTQTGIDTDILADKSNSALHISAMKGLVNIALFLIEAGCNVNLQNSSGKTSLHLAVQHKHGHLVKLLLENNADVNIRDTYDPKEHLYLVRGKNKGEPVWNYVEVKRALTGLLDKRVAANRVHLASFGSVLASGSGKDPPDDTKKKVRERVDAQVTKETKDKTALHCACGVSAVEVIDMLIEHGADCNARDANGFTPLHMAAISGNMEVVQKLVEHNVDVNLTTADGKDAAHYARLNEEWEIEQYLKSKRSPFRKLWNKLSMKR